MNKEVYVKTMSALRPSDETTRRIMDIPDEEAFTNHRRDHRLRPILLFAAILALLTAAGVTANAVTDGALLQSVGGFFVRVFIGEEQQNDPQDTVKKLYTGVDEDGNEVARFEIVPPEGATDNVRVVIEKENGVQCEIEQSPDGKSSFEIEQSPDGENSFEITVGN
ncbi:MAG: hypothetical protein IJK23_13830 [Clostridia bacterium]|nr:hypothetical protein [Clostridia bacterium]